MAETFTVFEKFGNVCAQLDEADRKELIYAINMYGMFGEEVELPYLLKALFISLKDDIDYSKSMRERGAKGGRPKKSDAKKTQVNKVSQNKKPMVSDNQKPEVYESKKPEVYEVLEPMVSDNVEPVVSGFFEKDETQYNTVQYKTEEKRKEKVEKRKEKRKRFVPPTVEDVRAHCAEKGYTFDPEAFVAFYESKGWKVGNSKMKSWRAACVTWAKRRESNRLGQVETVGDIYSTL